MKLDISICTKKYLFDPSLNHILLFHQNLNFSPNWIFHCLFWNTTEKIFCFLPHQLSILPLCNVCVLLYCIVHPMCFIIILCIQNNNKSTHSRILYRIKLCYTNFVLINSFVVPISTYCKILPDIIVPISFKEMLSALSRFLVVKVQGFLTEFFRLSDLQYRSDKFVGQL